MKFRDYHQTMRQNIIYYISLLFYFLIYSFKYSITNIKIRVIHEIFSKKIYTNILCSQKHP